ncbi:HD domain-containing protein [Enterovibrio sp. ZSDZ35]|uniref:HD domain-containing protein n=1 Tax=Enterovibrio qingdaonensis TaxID=2899818 RepID=A0ABT5QGV2_9GAMM|nr:HD domain-containing phosphohydrolase [Enterovibrio sp. ZSDZ35]MDD1780200.1 HD domain-containing protein [Enterovibrio sp. ZSDZ35]
MTALLKTHEDTGFQIDLRHAMLLFAKALDYVGIDDLYHGHRVAYTAYKCAERLGWPEKKVQFCFFAGLIHDCGVSQSQEHLLLLKEMVPQGAEAHCERGYEALYQCGVLASFANVIRYHHTPWEHLVHESITDDEKDVAALLFLSDRVDYLRAKYIGNCHENLVTLHQSYIAENIRTQAGFLFNDVMVEAMCGLILKEGFWFSMETDHIESLALSFDNDPNYDQLLTLDEMTEVAMFLAKIVDAKSPFTYQHSQKVADLSLFLGEKMDLSEREQAMIYVAGLVHDIGKLKTPDEILNKKGPLTSEEFVHIKRHTTDTELALNKVFPDSKICRWAADHHERLDGSGYPNRKIAEAIELPSRIIAVADVFQALMQNRPYRSALSSENALILMKEMVFKNKLDGEVMACLLSNIDECCAIATAKCQ